MMLQFADKMVPYKVFLHDLALELAPMLKQAMSDPSEVISQNKAYKMFGQANVMRWVKNGKLVPVAKRPGKVEYRISDLRCCQGIMQDYL
jgi:hypothetical protein